LTQIFAQECASSPSGTHPEASNVLHPLFPRAFLIITASAIAAVFPFFLLGILAGHDFAFHMNSWMEIAAQWKQGIPYPCWAQMASYGYGEPRFIFYPPISWLLGAALGTALPWKLVPGVFIWIALTLSGCSMFLLARNWLCRRDAIFAAALYATNPYYLIIIYWRSDFAELLGGALVPLLLLYGLRTPERGTKPLILLSLVVAAAWLTNAPAAVMVNYSLTLFALIVAGMRHSWRALAIGVVSLALGMGLAAIYILPAAYEQRWVAIGQVLASGFRPADNFLFTSTGDTGHDAFNRLVTMTAVAQVAAIILALPFVLRRRIIPRNALIVLSIWDAIAVLLMFPVSWAAWVIFPKLQFLQFPWRWLLCANVAFVLLVTVAWQNRYVRTGLYLGMVGMLVFGAWRIQRPWKDTAQDIARMAERQRTGEGYKSRPEYIPVGANMPQSDSNAKRAILESNLGAQVSVLKWDAESRLIVVTGSAPGRLILRLFNYPAWHAEVNGLPAVIEPVSPSGQISIPLPVGESRVRVTFNRTRDRLWGEIVSAASLILILALASKSLRGRSASTGS
jgi:hypothetical protein